MGTNKLKALVNEHGSNGFLKIQKVPIPDFKLLKVFLSDSINRGRSKYFLYKYFFIAGLKNVNDFRMEETKSNLKI